MMFQGEDRQTLQTMIDNNTVTAEDQQTPTKALKATQSCIKDEEHFWYFRDKVMSDVQLQPNEQIHALNTRITTLVNNCRFQDQNTTNTIKLMLLQHAVGFHEARDWIYLQDQSQLTYASLLQHCKTLEQRCEQYQKAQNQGKSQTNNPSLQQQPQCHQYIKIMLLYTIPSVPDVDTSTLVIIAQQKAENATTAMD